MKTSEINETIGRRMKYAKKHKWVGWCCDRCGRSMRWWYLECNAMNYHLDSKALAAAEAEVYGDPDKCNVAGCWWYAQEGVFGAQAEMWAGKKLIRHEVRHKDKLMACAGCLALAIRGQEKANEKG